jgi:hypothetical protein
MTAPLDDGDCQDIAALVRRFEDASIDTAGLHHRQHLMVAAWLLETSAYEVALSRMRTGLHALLEKVGKDAYHETVTVFWMRALKHQLSKCDASMSVDDRIRDAVTWAQTGEPLRAHYSAERLATTNAKRAFIEPDLKPLPDPQ